MLPSSDPLKGQEIDGYRILDILGRGGMGIVYKAEDMALLRSVALKMIDPSLVQDEAFLRRFRSEARALARIDNPNIVRVYALRQNERGVFIVMEYIDGSTLSDLIGYGPVPWPVAMPIIKQMLHAFAHAHELGIIHRDIKPGNIMLTPDGTVKVTDFGLAKMQRSDGTVTLTKGVTGTLFFMSPEQVKSSGDLDHRSDLYSLGMTVYQMLAGRLPFERSEGEFVIMRRIVEEPFPPPNTYHASLPDELVSIIMKALEKDPTLRFNSAGEMLEAFEAFEADAKPTTRNRESAEFPDAYRPYLQQTALSFDEAADRSLDEETVVLPKAGEETMVAGSRSPVPHAPPQKRRPVIQKKSPITKGRLKWVFISAIIVMASLGGYYWYSTFGSSLVSPPSELVITTTTLTIDTDPSEARIFLDGTEITTQTPLDAYLIEEGVLQILLQKEGRVPVDTTITASAGSPVILNISLPALAEDSLSFADVPPADRQQETEDVTRSPSDSPSPEDGREEQNEAVTEQQPRIQYGSLIIRSDPVGAEVWIDGQMQGTTPFEANNWEVGEYEYELRMPGYEPYNGTASVSAGMVESSGGTLTALPRGTLDAVVLPFGSIFIDDDLRSGSTNANYIEQLLPGTYRVKATHATYGIWEKEVRIEENEEQKIEFNFTEQFEVTVTSNPGIAEIFVDGQSTGSWTPSMVLLHPGQRSIEVKKNGFIMADRAKIITLEGNLSEPIHFNLEAEQ